MKILFSAPWHPLWKEWEWPDGMVWQTRSMSGPDINPDYWICNPSASFVIDGEMLDRMTNLKAIITPSTGTNHIDLSACREYNITVRSLLDDRDALDDISASSEFTFMLILLALRNGAFRQFRSWERDDHIMRGHELAGNLVGIVGFGRIGKNIARWVEAFGAFYVYQDVDTGDKLDGIFEVCDIVVISCTLNEETRGMITSRHLDRMKKGAILVNTARAEIIKEADLNKWAKKGRNIFATDVLHGEVFGIAARSPLLKLPNCIITPHIAGTTWESQTKAARIAYDLLLKEIE